MYISIEKKNVRVALTQMLVACMVLVALPSMAQWTWTPETGRLVNLKRLPKETPELQVEYARSLVVGKEYSRAFSETEKFVEYYGDSDWADDNQMLRGDIRLAKGEHAKAAEEYQLVITGYPDSPLYDAVIQQQYLVGDTLYEVGQNRVEKAENAPSWRLDRKWSPFKHRPLKRAIDVYTMVIDNQPFTETAAEAQYKVGLCYFTRGEYIEASFEYRRVLEDYSSSKWVKEALHGLAGAYENGSRPPAYDQAPSQLTVDTIAQFERQYPNDARIDDLLKVSKKMIENIAEQHFITARHYEKRSNPVAARMTYELLYDEYGQTKAGEQARMWLVENPPDGKAYSAFLAPKSVEG